MTLAKSLYMSLEITWHDIGLRLFLTVVGGALIGMNREEHGQGAGLRTTLGKGYLQLRACELQRLQIRQTMCELGFAVCVAVAALIALTLMLTHTCHLKSL
jgi:uncharacterized membrane protein YhiD involved in acid resistance